MKKEIKKGRDAKTGQFVTDEYVEENPDTTVTDNIHIEVKDEPEPTDEEQS